MSIKILLVDDHKIVCNGLRTLLEKEADMKVVGEAADGRAALRLSQEIKPDVVVMDVSLPELNGCEATRKIIAKLPKVKVIALSMYSDRKFVYRMFKAGASGYLPKDSAFEELSRAIRAVVKDQMYVYPGITDTVVREFVRKVVETKSSVLSVLTDREREVLQLISEGQSTKEIAYELDVSVKTIESHRQKTMQKLGIKSIAELTKYAIREGLTSL